VFHRDIKPENIAFDQKGTPYLTDFGICHITSDSSSSSSAFVSCESSGTLPYLAPEVLTKTHEHSYQSDFWSLGVVAYELMYGRRPFEPHVPLNFIYFVANQYYPNDCVNHFHTTSSSSSSPSVITEHPHIPRQCALPFPHYNATLNKDGTAPPSLLVPIFPTRSSSRSRSRCSSEKVDQHLMDLIGGLLDVRIPERLGSMDHFEDFSSHSAFVHYGYHTTLQLCTCPSPVLEDDWFGVLSNEIPHRTFKSQSPEAVDALDHKFNRLIESELEKLFYVRDCVGGPCEDKAVDFFNFAEDPKTQSTSTLSPCRDHHKTASTRYLQ
jgi:serine/threonine protein kinase